MRVVVSQPMYLPWAGLFEQIREADVFVHYDDVQLPRGSSFMTRVQLKQGEKVNWLSVPVLRRATQTIADARLDTTQRWAARHQRQIHHALAKAPFYALLEPLVDALVGRPWTHLAELNIHLTERIAALLGFQTRFHRASDFDFDSKSSVRLLDICRHFDADTYVTGHGARNYLDHDLFEAAGVGVEYMDYAIAPYPQPGEFTPYVTILDLIARTGPDAKTHMRSTTTDWRVSAGK